MSCNSLEELINSYLESLKLKGYSKSMLQIYEIPLRQLRDNCKWIEKDKVVILDITLFRHIISQNGKRAAKKKLSIVYLFVEYLKNEFNLDIEIKGDTKEVNFPKHQDPKEIIDNLMLQEQVLMGLFYGLNLKLKDISSLKIEDIKLKKDTLYIKKQQYHLYPELRESLSKLLNSAKGEYLFEQNGQNLTISKIRATLQNITKKIDIPQKDFRDSFKNLYKISQPKPQKIASSF